MILYRVKHCTRASSLHYTHQSTCCFCMEMKTNASSTASAWGIKRCIYQCEVSTKIANGGSKLQLSMYKLHKKVQQLFFLSYGHEIHTCATVKEHIEDKIFKILYILSHNIIEALLYQPLRFILTFKSNRSMVSCGRKHCKYDMYIYTFMHPF